MSVAELEWVRVAAADAGAPLSVVHNWLYYPVIRDFASASSWARSATRGAVEVTVAGEGSPDETYRDD